MFNGSRWHITAVFVFLCLGFGSVGADTLTLLSLITTAGLGDCPGDLTDDCKVDIQDLVEFAGQWLEGPGSDADFVGDDGVDAADFAVMAENWLTVKPIINEIHCNPDLAQELVEFVELHNPSDTAVDISGWQFTKGITYTFLPGTTLAAGGYIVVAEDPTPAVTDITITGKYGTSASLVKGPFTGNISNEGEAITLSDAAGNEIDTVEYQLGFPWPTVGDAVPDDDAHPGTGHSIQLVNSAFDNDLGGNWRSAYPTPGAANTAVYAANNPPCIRQVEHSPNQPKAGEVVTITAKVTDNDGVSSVTLKYQLNDPGNYIPKTLPISGSPPTQANPAYEAGWNNLTMYDDGLNGDIEAGDGVYTVQISAAIQTHRRLVRYRITAVDTGARSITVPYTDDPQSNFAYFVYTGVPSWTGNGVTYTSEVLTSLPVYHLISRNSDVEACTWNSGWDDGLYHFVGTLVYDGEVYDHVPYHVRGQYSTFRWGKNKWKFNFTRGHYFQAEDDYGNKYANKWNNLNLGTGTCPWWQWPHPGSWDQGAGGMLLNECMTMRLYNMVGAIASNTNYFHFRIIDGAAESGATQYDGDFWGLYYAIEEPDGRLLKEHGLADGNIYKMDGSPDKFNQGPTQVTDYTDINTFTANQSSSSSQAWWEANVNLDRFYSFKTVGIVINNSDPRPQQNCFYYHDPVTNKWSIHPWDVELTYEWATHYTGWENISSCLNYSVLNIAYKNRARELVDLLFDNNNGGWRQTDQLVDEMATIIANSYNGQRFIDAEQAMWNTNPHVSSYSNLWYQHNEFFTQPGNSANWDYMVAYYKQYLTAAGMSGFLSGSYGLYSLNTSIADTLIPNTPTITYTGATGYPENDLRFQTSTFSGSGAFAAYQWRIARVDDPSAVGYVVRERHNYEVETKWQSPDITDSGQLTVRIPADEVEVGGTYRVRCRMKDSTGRCGHWSSPIQFVAGAGALTDMLRYLRVTELMYNPAAPSAAEITAGYTDNDDFEFIELKNTGSTTLDLTDTYFSDGIEYSFGGMVTGTTLLSTGFDSSSNGFTYADNTFGANNAAAVTNNAAYATGTYEITGGQTGGGLYVYLGITPTNSNPMSGGWSRTFTLSQAGIVTINVNYRLILGSGLDSGEYGVAVLAVDGLWYGGETTGYGTTGNCLMQRMGNGTGGSDDDYGWQSYQTTIGFSAGTHTITLGGYCNRANSTAEWVEVFFDNVTVTATTTTTTSVTLAPGAYVLIVKNQAAFEARYGTGLSSLIAGEYTGSLNNAGETIRLTDAWDGNIFKFSYNDGYGWPVSADGPGHSLVPIDSAIAGEHDGSLEYGGNWRASTYIKGSPGVVDPTPISSIMINEVMAHTDTTEYPGYDSNDWIELYNPTGTAITLGSNWYLSDNADNLKKWALPAGSIAATGRVSFDEVTGFHSPITSGFGLNKTGEYVFLSWLPGTSEDRVIDYVKFSGQYNTVSLGRYPDGGMYWFKLANPGTRGAANANPVQHSVVISEIMYHPTEGTTNEEYIELYNPTTSAVALYNANGTWRLDNAVSYVFPAGKSISGGGKIVVVPFDPAVETDRLTAFNTAYGCGLVANSTIFGPWTGDLSNNGERIALQAPQEADPPSIMTIWWINVDQVIYGDYTPWPIEPDGTGPALGRISSSASASGDDPANWNSITPSPGN